MPFLRGANLEKIDFRGSDLRNADLTKTNLVGANLSNAKMACTKLLNARTSAMLKQHQEKNKLAKTKQKRPDKGKKKPWWRW